MTEPVALRVKEFCRLYSIGRTTAYKLAAEGKIVMLRMGQRHTVVTEESARRWHASRQSEQQPPKQLPPEHKVWEGMLARCNNPNRPDFQWYGERGIREGK